MAFMVSPMSPIDEEFLKVVLNEYSKVSRIILGGVSAVFMGKMALGALTLAPAEEFMESVKDLLLFFLILTLIPEFTKILVESSAGLSSAVIGTMSFSEVSEDGGFFSTAHSAFNSLMEEYAVVHFLVNLLPLGLTQFAEILASLIIGVLVVFSPVVLLLRFMIDSPRGMTIYLSTVVSFLLWPLMWNIVGLLGQKSAALYEGSSMRAIIFWAALSVVQFISPFISVFVLQSLSMQGAARGALSIGKTITSRFLR